jgi:hypothetical protein
MSNQGKRIEVHEGAMQELRTELSSVRAEIAAQTSAIASRPAESPADLDARVDARVREVLKDVLPGAIEAEFANGSVYISIGTNAAPSPAPETAPVEEASNVIEAGNRFGQPVVSSAPEMPNDLAAAA